MISKGRKWVLVFVSFVGILIVLSMAVNIYMTYILEGRLRTHLRAEVIKATDGAYDFSYKTLNVGFFSGELMIEGLELTPNDKILMEQRKDANQAFMSFDVYLDTIFFRGINLAWTFDYRKLSFKEFSLKNPSIRIVSTQAENTLDSLAYRKLENTSLFEKISPHFDMVQARHINFENAQIEYIVQDSTLSVYSLKNFNFTAHNFVLDEHSDQKADLMYSNDFEFYTNQTQTIFDSDHFSFRLDQMRLSTIDSVVHVANAQLKAKDKIWDKRFTHTGTCVNAQVGDILLNGISLKRDKKNNYFEARNLSINEPNIEYFNVFEEQTKQQTTSADTILSYTPSWSLYSIISPIFNKVYINNIRVDAAQFLYNETKDNETDYFKLSHLDFRAQHFLVDSLSHQYNFFIYVKDFSIDAKDIVSHVASRNSSLHLGSLHLNTMDQVFEASDIKIAPIHTSIYNSYSSGYVGNIKIDGLTYDTGIKVKEISISSPRVNFVLGKSAQPANMKTQSQDAENILDAISPFISYLYIDAISIHNGNATLLDRKNDINYTLSNLDFYVKNFQIDKETRLLKDYFFKWDEYQFSFQDFDNLTPDKKYRVQIKEGDFDSVAGDMILRGFRLSPEGEKAGSYLSVATPNAALLGLDQKALFQKKIAFKTFILESPHIEIVREDDPTNKELEQGVRNIDLDLISFNLLTIPSPSLSYYNATDKLSAQVQAIQMHVDSFTWKAREGLSLDNLIIESPEVSIVQAKKTTKKADDNQMIDLSSFGIIKVRNINIRKPILSIKNPKITFDFSAENYLLKNLYWNHTSHSLLEIKGLDFIKPQFCIVELEPNGKASSKNFSIPLTRETIIEKISVYANQTKLGRINLENLNLKHYHYNQTEANLKNKLIETSLLVEDLDTDIAIKKLDLGEFYFKTKDIDQAIGDFYKLRIGNVDFSKREARLDINNIRLHANYPKFDFAYIHPTGKDWFNVAVDEINFSGIDFSHFISDTTLFVDKIVVDHVLLENMKNQKIEVKRNIMPLFYEAFQDFPLKYNVKELDIRDFNVIYEELAKNGQTPARLPFSNMNGKVQHFTNIQKGDNSFYTVHADGLVMGTAPFAAEWVIPVDSTNDQFYFNGIVRNLDMKDFNQVVHPMAPVYIESGKLDVLAFESAATSIGATIEMKFSYDSLYILLLKNMNSHEEQRMLTDLVNRWAISPYNKGKTFRVANKEIVRNPYHSNFNYFWQILQPPLVESVGITQGKLNIVHNYNILFNKIKAFFGRKKKKEETLQK